METHDSNKWHELAKSAIHSFYLTGAETKLLQELENLEKIQVKEFSLRLSAALPPDNPKELVDAERDDLFAKWGKERTIRPSFLAWFFNDKEVQLLNRNKKIFISNCLISPTGAITIADSQDSLDLSDATLPFTLELDHCVFPKKIFLNHATVRELTFENCWLFGLNGCDMIVQGNLRIANCRMPSMSLSIIDISRSQISGSVQYSDCVGPGIICDEATIREDLKFQNVSLSNISAGGIILSPMISVERAKIGGEATLNEIEGVAMIKMSGTTISKDLKLNEIKFASGVGVISNGFHATHLVVEGMFSWWRCTRNDATELWLDGGRADTLGGDESMKVGPSHLWLNGFEYRNLAFPLSHELDKWLVNQRAWTRQPYEQYARWVRNQSPPMATKVLIAAETERRHRQGYNRLWSSVIRVTTAYGYDLFLSLKWITGLVIVGAVVFNWAYSVGALPSVGGKAPLPTFNPFFYSLDVFLPIIDFQQASYWIPAGNDLNGLLVQYFSWLHIALGWFFTTMAVAGFTGFLKGKGE